MPINWTPENNHKMLLYLLKRIETKDIDVDNLAALFEGATPKAIRERVAKLRRESKLVDDGPENPIVPNNNNHPAATSSIDDNNSSPVKGAGKARGRPKKSAKNVTAENGGPVANGKGGKTGGGGKRKRGVREKEVEEGYGGDVEEEESGEGVKDDGEGGVKKVKTEEMDGEGGEKDLEEGGFMMEEAEGEGEVEDEGGEMVEA